jgi:plastocyanin
VAATVVMVGTTVLTGCGVDGPDVYAVPEVVDTPTTVRTLPSTTMPPPPNAAGDTTVAPAEPVAPNGEVVQVRSLDNTFRVADIEIVAGTEVWWTNSGRNEHNVLPVDENEDWGVATEDFVPGDEYRHVFGLPGTYLYYCSIHGTTTVGMVGSVTVLPADA